MKNVKPGEVSADNAVKPDKLVVTRLVEGHIASHGRVPNNQEFESLIEMAKKISQVCGIEPEMQSLIDLAKKAIATSLPAEQVN